MFDDTHDPMTEMRKRRAEAEASIRAQQKRQEAAGHALMAGFEAYGSAASGNGLFAKINRGAKWALIWFFMIVPILLVIEARW
jgi:hypothetical protein